MVHWYVYPMQFLSGMVLANGVPHFVHGIRGKKFPTPFAKPPGVGESPPLVNVLWGVANFLVGGVLLFRHLPETGDFVLGWVLVAAGFIFSAWFLARYLARVRAQRP
jgi:hypothetical protein